VADITGKLMLAYRTVYDGLLRVAEQLNEQLIDLKTSQVTGPTRSHPMSDAPPEIKKKYFNIPDSKLIWSHGYGNDNFLSFADEEELRKREEKEKLEIERRVNRMMAKIEVGYPVTTDEVKDSRTAFELSRKLCFSIQEDNLASTMLMRQTVSKLESMGKVKVESVDYLEHLSNDLHEKISDQSTGSMYPRGTYIPKADYDEVEKQLLEKIDKKHRDTALKVLRLVQSRAVPKVSKGSSTTMTSATINLLLDRDEGKLLARLSQAEEKLLRAEKEHLDVTFKAGALSNLVDELMKEMEERQLSIYNLLMQLGLKDHADLFLKDNQDKMQRFVKMAKDDGKLGSALKYSKNIRDAMMRLALTGVDLIKDIDKDPSSPAPFNKFKLKIKEISKGLVTDDMKSTIKDAEDPFELDLALSQNKTFDNVYPKLLSPGRTLSPVNASLLNADGSVSKDGRTIEKFAIEPKKIDGDGENVETSMFEKSISPKSKKPKNKDGKKDTGGDQLKESVVIVGSNETLEAPIKRKLDNGDIVEIAEVKTKDKSNSEQRKFVLKIISSKQKNDMTAEMLHNKLFESQLQSNYWEGKKSSYDGLPAFNHIDRSFDSGHPGRDQSNPTSTNNLEKNSQGKDQLNSQGSKKNIAILENSKYSGLTFGGGKGDQRRFTKNESSGGLEGWKQGTQFDLESTDQYHIRKSSIDKGISSLQGVSKSVENSRQGSRNNLNPTSIANLAEERRSDSVQHIKISTHDRKNSLTKSNFGATGYKNGFRTTAHTGASTQETSMRTDGADPINSIGNQTDQNWNKTGNSSNFKLAGFLTHKKKKENRTEGSLSLKSTKVGGDYKVLPPMNVFNNLSSDGQVKTTFLDDIYELLVAGGSTNIIDDQGKVIQFSKKNLEREINRFVKHHMSCGAYCSHLVRFYQRIGFLKALSWVDSKEQYMLPKVNVGEEKTIRSLLERLKLSTQTLPWTVTYVTSP